MSTPIATFEARVFEASPTSRWIGACTAPVVAYALYVVASHWGSERAGLAVFWTGMFFQLWLDTFRDSVVRAELRGDALLVGRLRRRLIKLADIVRLRVSTTGTSRSRLSAIG